MKRLYLCRAASAKLYALLGCLLLAANSIKAQTPAITEEWVQIWNGTDSLMDQATAIGADGFIYICGMSVSGTTDGDYVVLKYSPAGALIWSVIYNGADNLRDGAVAITTDANSNVYVTGSSNSAAFSTDIVTLKIDPSGTILWEHRYNGTANGNDEGQAIKIDGNNIYVLGGTNSLNSYSDIVLLKYDPSGNLLWDALYNGPANGYDDARMLALDGSGNIYLAGASESVALGFDRDMITLKYDAAGNLLWEARYEGAAGFSDGANDIAIDGINNVVITGVSTETSNDDITTIKYNSFGTLQWVAHYNGADNLHDAGIAIRTDAQNNVLVMGSSGSPTGTNVIALKYDATGTQQWVAVYNSRNPVAMEANSAGDMYITGRTSGKASDIFTLKFDAAGLFEWEKIYNGPGNSGDGSFALALDDENNVYVTGFAKGTLTGFDIVTVKYSEEQQPCNLTADAGNDTVIFAGQSVQIGTEPITGNTYSWSLPDGLSDANIANPVASPESATTYFLTIAGNNGCSATDSVEINIIASGSVDTNIAIFSDAGYDSLIRVVWSKVEYFNASKYILEKSTDKINFEAIDSILIDSLIDVFIPGANSNIIFSAEKDIESFVSIMIENDYGMMSKTEYRVKILDPFENYIYTQQVPIAGISFPVTEFGTCPAIGTPPAGSVSTGITQQITDADLCCIITQTKYRIGNCFPDPIFSPMYLNCSQEVASGTVDCSCDCGCTYDPCCEHTCANKFGIKDGNGNYLINPCSCPQAWASCNSLIPCSLVWVVTSVEPYNPSVSIQVSKPPFLCQGENIFIIASSTHQGPVNYTWTPAAGLSSTTGAIVNATPQVTTTYTVTGTTAEGCTTSSASVTITVLNSPITITALPNPICSGQISSVLTACCAGSFSWSPSTGLSATTGSTVAASPTQTTTYTVTGITSVPGKTCTSVADITVNVYPLPALGTTVANGCQGQTGGSITTTVSGGTPQYSYLWSNGAVTPNLSGLATGTYSVTVTDANGCMDEDETTVTVNPVPVANAGPDETYCIGSAVPAALGTISGFSCTTGSGGTPPYTYQWSMTSLPQTPVTFNSALCLTTFTANYPATYTFTVTVTDANGCTAADQKAVTVKTAGQCCAEAYAYTYKSITVNNNTMASCTLTNGNVVPMAVSTLFTSGTATFSVKESITFNAPVNVIISKRTIKFGPGPSGRMIIRAGASIRVTGSTLTAIECPTVMWEGIAVEGKPNLPQFPVSNQGQITFHENSVVRDAHAGITNIYNAFGGGGIIKADNARFINNRYAVLLAPYTFQTGGQMAFNNCLYETNAPMKDIAAYGNNASHAAFIFIWKQYYKVPLKISSNIFRVTAPSILAGSLNPRGNGIQSIDSDYWVNKAKGAKGANTFQNLDIAIDINRGLNNQGPEPYTVSIFNNNTFTNNWIGVMQTGNSSTAGWVKIGDNTFNQTVFFPPTGPQPHSIGIYNNGIGKIDILENSFSKHTVGIYSNNSGTGWLSGTNWNNNAWNNIFNNCGRGVEFTRDNSRFQVQCNNFNNNLNLAEAHWVVNNGNVRNPQGGCSGGTFPTGNKYNGTLPPNKNISLIWPFPGLFDPSFTYWYFNGAANENPGAPNTINLGGTCVFTANGCGTPNKCNQAPQKISGGNPGQLAQQLAAATNQQERMELIQEMLFALVDNGKLDSIIPFLENIPDTEAKWLLVPEYISVKRYTDAETVLSNLQKDNLEKQKKDEYYKVHIDLGKTDRIPTDMTVLEKTSVESVAISETEISYNAKALLHFWFNENYEPELAVLGNGSNKLAGGNTAATENIIPEMAVNDESGKISRIYPNPNNGTMQIDYSLDKEAILCFYDVTGRLIGSFRMNGNENPQAINIHLNNGIFYYELMADGEILLKEKLVIIK